MNRNVCVVGVGHADGPFETGLSQYQLIAQAFRRALDDAGLHKDDIEGLASAGYGGMHEVAVAEYLGLRPQWLESTSCGGSSFEFHAQHAFRAIAAGAVDTIAIVYGNNQLSANGRTLGTGGGAARGSVTPPGPMKYEYPTGLTLVGAYALAAQRHMHEFGTTPEQLASVSVQMREHAARNPHAMYRTPISVDDVLGSNLVADPLHKLDCCVISDGGCAVILTTEEKARELAHRPVFVRGAAGGTSHHSIVSMDDMTRTAAAISGPKAFAEAGITPSDVDVARCDAGFGEGLRATDRRRGTGHVVHRDDRVVAGATGGTTHEDGPVCQFTGLLLGGEDHSAPTVGDHATVEFVQRIGDEVRTEDVVDGDRRAVHRMRIAGRVLAHLHRHRRKLLGGRAELVHVPLGRERVGTHERQPRRVFVFHRSGRRDRTAGCTTTGAERAAIGRQLIVAVHDGDRVDCPRGDGTECMLGMELEAAATTTRRLEPLRSEPEILGDRHFVHTAVSGAGEPLDVVFVEPGVVEGTTERLRDQLVLREAGLERSVGVPDTDDTHVAIHAGTLPTRPTRRPEIS